MEITNINSKNALLTFSREDLAEHDLVRWVKSNTIGIGRKHFIDEAPFERVASKLYNEKNPSKQVKYGKAFRDTDGTISVFLSVTEGMSKDYIKNQHPDKLVFSHQPKYKASAPTAVDNVVRREASYKEKGEVYFKVASLDNVKGMTDNKIFNELLKQAEATDFDITCFSSIPMSDNEKLIEFSSGDIRMIVAVDMSNNAKLYTVQPETVTGNEGTEQDVESAYGKKAEEIFTDNVKEDIDNVGIEEEGVSCSCEKGNCTCDTSYIKQDLNTKGLQ